MASNNRVFPFIHSNIVSPEQNCQSIFYLFPSLNLYWFCYCFIAISILVLTTQCLAVHSVETQSCFLPLFARTHHLAKSLIYTTVELLKRIPLGVIRYKRAVIKQYLFQYAYFYIACMTCYTLHTQWLLLRPPCSVEQGQIIFQ